MRRTTMAGLVLGGCLTAWLSACGAFGEAGTSPPAGDAGVSSEAGEAGTPDGAPRDDAATGTPSAYAAAVLADQPVLYWRLGDFVGGAVKDGTTNGRDGTGSTAGIFLEPSLIAGDMDRAFRFTVGTSLERKSDDDLNFADRKAFSLECWVRLDAAVTGTAILAAREDELAAAQHGYALYMEADGRVYFGRYESIGVTHASASALSLGVPHHIVGVYDGTAVRISTDGVEDGFSNTPVLLKPHAVPFTVGRASASPGKLAAIIDEVAIYPFALPASRIAEHHRIGAGQ